MASSDLVFILAGQSNMVGWTESHFYELPSWMKIKPVRLEFYNSGRQMEFWHQPGGRIGPEVSFGKYIAGWYPGRRIALVKLAVGGTSIYDWARVWNPAISYRMTESSIQNSLYALLKRQVELSKVLENGNKVAAFLWMQGERDARYPQAANAYFGNLRNLVNDFRREYQSPDAPFILGRVNPLLLHHPAIATIRQAQEQASQQLPGVALVNTDDLPKAADQIHYNTKGEEFLGRRFADEFRRRVPV